MRRAVTLVLALGLLGCSPTLHRVAAPDISAPLTFLRDGETRESQVVERLGPTMRRFPEGVVIYRLWIESKQLLPTSSAYCLPSVSCYDLILVFDVSGILKTHSLLRVQ